MKITLNHPKSKGGMPVFINDARQVIATAAALKKIRVDCLKLSVPAFAALLGTSPRTVNGWEQGRPPSAAALFLLESKLNAGLDRLRT